MIAKLNISLPSMTDSASVVPVEGVELSPEQALLCLQAVSNYVVQLRNTKNVSPQFRTDVEGLELALGQALIGEVEVDVD